MNTKVWLVKSEVDEVEAVFADGQSATNFIERRAYRYGWRVEAWKVNEA